MRKKEREVKPQTLFEDSQVLAVNKPSGMVVNRADSVVGQTVQEWVEKYLKIPSTKHQISNKSEIRNLNVPKSLEFSPPRFAWRGRGNLNLEFVRRAGIVHRLDKETSGVLLIAKNPRAFGNLQQQFKQRKVEKTYLALVHGRVPAGTGRPSVIKLPIGRLPWNREKFGVLPLGRPAETSYGLVRVYLSPLKEALSLLELKPKTGRTHQLRVHLKSIGHPVVADSIYTGRKTARRDRVWCPRLFLHASKISFKHPKSGARLGVKAGLPQDLKMVLQTINN